MNWVLRLVLQGIALLLVVAIGVLLGYGPTVSTFGEDPATAECSSVVGAGWPVAPETLDDTLRQEGTTDTSSASDATGLAEQCQSRRTFFVAVVALLTIPLGVIVTLLIVRPVARAEARTPESPPTTTSPVVD